MGERPASSWGGEAGRGGDEAAVHGPGLLSSILDGLPTPVFVKDEEHRWIVLNESYCRFMGYSREELLGKSDYDFFPRHEAEVFWEKDDVVFRTGQTNENEEHFTDAEGRRHVILTRKSLHVDASGRRLLIGVITDITERKQMEEELRRSRDDLDERVRERTAALEEEGRRKTEFLALLAHELRNPLTPIRTAVHVLRAADPEALGQSRGLGIIERQVAHMTRLIEDLLDVSRVSRGGLLLRRVSCDLTELVRAAVDDWRDSFRDHGLRLVLQAPPGPLLGEVDPARVAQALGNLLDNAKKFSPPAGTVTVAVKVDPDGRGVSVGVRDEGVGMTPQTAARLWTPFAAVGRDADASEGGLGLGLSLVRAFAELHGGRSTASSPGPGQGAEFVIWLPLSPAPVAVSSAPPEPAARRERHRVLVIEDNLDAAEMIELALSLAGHSVTVAHNGEEGLRLAEELRPTVVLSDIRMPGMTGYDVARALRRDGRFADTHLVAVTGFGQVEDRQRSAEAGFEHHLTKPFDVATLESLVASLPPRGS